MLVAMLACAVWDPWCSYQTPLTTEFLSALGSAFRSLKKLAEIMLTPKTIRNALPSILLRLRDVVGIVRERPSVLKHIFRRPEEMPEVIDMKSLHWMLEHAPRGRPLRLVAQQVARVKPPSDPSDFQDVIRRSPHIHRLHETFWDTVRRVVLRRDVQKLRNANDEAEALVDIAIFGKSIVATSCQWPANSIEDVMRNSFNGYASLITGYLGTVSCCGNSWRSLTPCVRFPSIFAKLLNFQDEAAKSGLRLWLEYYAISERQSS